MNEDMFRTFDQWLRSEGYLMGEDSTSTLHRVLWLVAVLLFGYLVGLICRRVVIPLVAKVVSKTKATWDDYLFNPRVLRSISHLVPAMVVYVVIPYVFIGTGLWLDILLRISQIWLIIVGIRFFTALISSVYELSTQHEDLRDRPLKGVYQMLKIIVICVGVIGVVSVLVNRSPLALFTALGAAATVLMLIFKDTIIGLVAGVQLSANDMLRIGDWIALPGGVANGVVEEITLNTVKIRNWDETISTVPPYTLVNNSFQNWRGMQESGGRRVNKNIFLDMTTLKFCTPEMLDNIRKEVPLMADYQPAEEEVPTNAQLYRIYIERYLCSLPVVNQEMDLIISQKEPTTYGVPIQVYFFSRNKVWKEYERIQSDIFDHLLVMVQKFDLKLYQYSD